jgi:hypothetical protein
MICINVLASSTKLIGSLGGWFLLGVLSMQLCTRTRDPSRFTNLTVAVDVYHIIFANDRWWIKFTGVSGLL